MRRISSLAVAATTALSIAALGAGIKSASAASATYNWSGFYMGLNAGGGWGKSNTTATGNENVWFPASYGVTVNGAGTQSQSPKGFVGGAQAGFNWQNGIWVAGIETDFQAFGLKNTLDQTTIDPAFPGFPIVSTSEVKTDWLFTARPRLGIAQNNLLIYGTGGVAVTRIKFNQFFNFPASGLTETASVSQTKTGWTLGGGLEWAWMKNWSIKAEYLYAKFGSVSAVGVYSTAGLPTTVSTADLKANIVRVGINYKFGP